MGSKKIKISSTIIVLLILSITIFLTWVIPHDPYDGADWVSGGIVIEAPKNGKFGIFDFGISLFVGLYDMLGISIFVILLGVIVKILNENKVLENTLLKGIEKINFNPWIFIPTFFIFSSMSASVWGAFETSILYFSVIMIAFKKMKIKDSYSIFVLLFAVGIGRAFSTFSPYAYTAAISNLSPEWDSIITTGFKLSERIIYWSIFTTVSAIVTTIFIIKKSKNVKINTNTKLKTNVKLKNKDFLAIFLFFIGMIIIILGIIPWNSFMGSTMEDWTAWWNENMWFISTIMNAPGNWSFKEFSMILMPILICFFIIYRKGENPPKILSIGNVIVFLLPAILTFSFSKSTSFVLTFSGLGALIVETASSSIKSQSSIIFVFTILMVIFLYTAFVNSQAGAGALFMPIVSSIVANSFGTEIEGQKILFSIMFGMTAIIGLNAMVTPSQAMVFISIKESGNSYKEYVKSIAPIWISIFGAVLTMALVMAM